MQTARGLRGIARPHDEHGARAVADHAVRHAAQHPAFDAGATVCRHDYEGILRLVVPDGATAEEPMGP